MTDRTISGLVLPWDATGYTSVGAVTVPRGVVSLPEDIGRVKLFRDHSTQPGSTPVGYATASRDTNVGLEVDFRVANSPDGDLALADVSDRVRDALSVELVDVQIDGDRLTSATLTAVALVAVPAFSEARVSTVTASTSRKDTLTMTLTQGTLTASHAHGIEPDTEDSTAPVETIPEAPETTDETDALAEDETTKAPALAAARAPRGIVTGPGRAELSFSAAIDAITAMRTGAPTVTAALADITRSANPSVSAPMWLGEMWSGVDYEREIVPTMTQKPLTRLKGIGFRWVKRPAVDDYKGDKTEVPTGTVTTEPVEVTAQRLAAGHDIDRAYFDFNEREFLDAFFRARATDYAMKTDTKAAQFLAASAKTGAKIKAEPDLLHAAARARMEVKRRTRVEPTTYLVNPSTMFGLFAITQLDNPAYLKLLGVEPEKVVTSDMVPENEVIAYAKQSVTWFELAGSPIRVDAERIDHGGKDSGIFGYWAALLNNQDGIVSVPIAPAPATPPASGA